MSSGHRTKHRSRHSDRSGFSIVETIIAGLLVGAIIAIAVPTLRWIGLERRSADRRQLAMFEASNLLEQLSARSWDDLKSELAAGLGLSDEAAQQLPDAELLVSIEPGEGTPEAKRLLVEVRWRDREQVAGPSVQLVAWVYRQREGK